MLPFPPSFPANFFPSISHSLHPPSTANSDTFACNLRPNHHVSTEAGSHVLQVSEGGGAEKGRRGGEGEEGERGRPLSTTLPTLTPLTPHRATGVPQRGSQRQKWEEGGSLLKRASLPSGPSLWYYKTPSRCVCVCVCVYVNLGLEAARSSLWLVAAINFHNFTNRTWLKSSWGS